jgi:hypothetical protein
MYIPNRPTPAGPRRIAVAFVRTMPMRIVAAEEIPITAEDARIAV